ncbi:ATP-binding cassette subfamily C protein CydC [Virgibacillus halotolerans]|uniref:thiol reductant ABC exporter subunit CydC n=1 Tax=Virgibacillus halotolerans TaxID=1071053 RepID=UPI00195FEEC4|nr:thiol reductant ABC exporter subunit CydC [Virgibacillus halotolerans]MBM7600292.1 ATP-binding cassette subfamily C protein CydC [Virgibacillus halotolerans]
MKDLALVVKLTVMEKKDILLSIIFGFVTGIAAVGLFAASGYLISKAALAPPLYALIILTASVKMLGFIRAFSRYGERYFSHRATFTMLSNLRVSFFEKLEPLAPGIFQKFRSGDLLARIVGDVETLQNFFLRVFYPPIVLIMVFLSTILFTSVYSVHVAFILLAGLLLTTFIVPAFFALKQGKVDRKVRERRGNLSTEVTEFLYGYRDLKIYQQLEDKEAQLKQVSQAYIEEQQQEGVHHIFSQSANLMVSLIVSWSVLGVGAYLVADGQMDGIFLAMFLMISLTVFENATPMAAFPIHLQDSRQAANRLFSVVGKDEDAVDETVDDMQEWVAVGQAPAIKMTDVSFSFPEEIRQTIKNVSLSLPAGSKTAIVGPSGSGKSTLLQLLLKISVVDQGEIRMGDIAMNHIPQESIWEKANVVLQKNHFFYGSLRENLQLAKDTASDDELEAVLNKVQLEYLSLSDQVLEKGENLSGGEKQRLAIARVMLKDAPLWILDEPTSSVDALTEDHIYRHLFDQAEDDTLVLVSHRLTGMEKMDQIIVMEEGSIVEAGTYSVLMDKQGYFYELKQIEQSVFMS